MVYNILGDWLFEIVSYLLIILGIVLLAISIAYIFLVYKNVKEYNSIEKRKSYWEKLLEDYEEGKIEKKHLIKKIDKKKYFKDYLIEQAKEDKFDHDVLKEIYISCGFASEDVDKLKSKRWYNKAQTFATWKKLRILPNDQYVIPHLLSQNNEVRLAALDLLTIHRHHTLKEKIEDIFNFYSTHVDDYLHVKLMAAEIPVKHLKNLTRYDNHRLKKAGVILLGREGEKDSIDILKNFKDSSEDIRSEVVKSIGRIKSIDGLDILKKMKNDESTRVRKEIAISLSKISSEGGLDSWEELTIALGQTETKDTIPLLDELANDEDPEVRLNAFLALSSFGKKGREKIEDYRDKYPETTNEALRKSFLGGGNFDAI